MIPMLGSHSDFGKHLGKRRALALHLLHGTSVSIATFYQGFLPLIWLLQADLWESRYLRIEKPYTAAGNPQILQVKEVALEPQSILIKIGF